MFVESKYRVDGAVVDYSGQDLFDWDKVAVKGLERFGILGEDFFCQRCCGQCAEFYGLKVQPELACGIDSGLKRYGSDGGVFVFFDGCHQKDGLFGKGGGGGVEGYAVIAGQRQSCEYVVKACLFDGEGKRPAELELIVEVGGQCICKVGADLVGMVRYGWTIHGRGTA